jgi:hypothetical protein
MKVVVMQIKPPFRDKNSHFCSIILMTPDERVHYAMQIYTFKGAKVLILRQNNYCPKITHLRFFLMHLSIK